jgi:hypothetical protein
MLRYHLHSPLMNGPSWSASVGENSALLLPAYTCACWPGAIGDRMMQVRLRLQGTVVSALDGVKAAVPGQDRELRAGL